MADEPGPARFQVKDNDQIKDHIESKTAQNTRRATKGAFNVFLDFLREVYPVSLTAKFADSSSQSEVELSENEAKDLDCKSLTCSV